MTNDMKKRRNDENDSDCDLTRLLHVHINTLGFLSDQQ